MSAISAYWQEQAWLHFVFRNGRVPENAPGLYKIDRATLEESWWSSLAVEKTQMLLLAPFIALDAKGRYVLPCLLRYRYQEGEWRLQEDPSVWVPFGLFDSHSEEVPLGRAQEYHHTRWQTVTRRPSEPLLKQIERLLQQLYPTLGKTQQAAKGLKPLPFALCIACDEYVKATPFLLCLQQFKKMLEEPTGCLAHFLGNSPSGSIAAPPSLETIEHLEKGRTYAVCTPIGSAKSTWLLSMLEQAWLLQQTRKEPWKAVYVGDASFETTSVGSPWDPANRLIVRGAPEETSLTPDARRQAFLLAGGYRDFRTAIYTLHREIIKITQAFKQGQTLLSQYRSSMGGLTEVTADIQQLQKQDFDLEQSFDELSSEILQLEMHRKTSMLEWLSFKGFNKKAQLIHLLKKKYVLGDIAEKDLVPLLGEKIRAMRMQRQRIQAELKEKYAIRTTLGEWQAQWEQWWAVAYGDTAVRYPGLEFNIQDPNWLAPLRQQWFWASWHMQEARALLKKEAPVLNPLLQCIDEASFLEQAAEEPPLAQWLFVDTAERLSLLSGACYASLTERMVLLGDPERYHLPLVQESQTDFQNLKTRGLIESEADYEDLESLGLIAARNSAWDRVCALLMAEGAPAEPLLSHQEARASTLNQLAKALYPRRLGWQILEGPLGKLSLQLWDYPGQCVWEDGQCSNQEQALWLVERLEEEDFSDPNHESSHQGNRVVIVTPFIRQKRLLQASLLAKGIKGIEVRLVEELGKQLYDVLILSMVLTSKDPQPFCYDEGTALWSTLVLSTRLSLYIVGERALFDPKTHSPTGKLAKYIPGVYAHCE